MRIITLTSDMGLKDYYVGALKGFILKNCPNVQIVDISHQIRAFSIVEAAFCVKNIIQDFPDDTIHVLAVNDEPKIDINIPQSSHHWPTVMRFQNQYFVGMDNGIFSLILEGNEPEYLYRMTEMVTKPGIHNFPSKNILSKIACHIANGEELESLGERTYSVTSASDFVPVIESHKILGHIVHVDAYGNLITNVSKKLFFEVGQNAPFKIEFRNKSTYIDTIHQTYSGVESGDRVAIFNSSELLEIAINMGAVNNGGGASSLLGIKERDLIKIEFQPKGSKDTIDSLF